MFIVYVDICYDGNLFICTDCMRFIVKIHLIHLVGLHLYLNGRLHGSYVLMLIIIYYIKKIYGEYMMEHCM